MSKRIVDKFGYTVIDGEIVSANWFKRNLERIWDFLYDHVLPVRAWYALCDLKRKVVYGLERAFTGYDRTISWGPESSIRFYKRLLSDLYENVHGWPGNLEGICDEEWNEVKEKWVKVIGEEGFAKAARFTGEYDFAEEALREEFEGDAFAAWKKYIRRVLRYFEEADPESCSKRTQQKELYKKFKSPFDPKDRKVVLHNGIFVAQYGSLGDSEEDKEQRKILDALNEIDKYMSENLKRGMAEMAKNVNYLCD